MYIVSSNWTGEFKSCKVEEIWSSGRVSDHGSKCLGFESRWRRGWDSCLTQNIHNELEKPLFSQGSEHREQLSINSENLFRNRFKRNKFKANVTFRVSKTFCAFRDNIFFTCSDFIKNNAAIYHNCTSYEYKFIFLPPLNMHPKFRAQEQSFSTLLSICFQE